MPDDSFWNDDSNGSSSPFGGSSGSPYGGSGGSGTPSGGSSGSPYGSSSGSPYSSGSTSSSGSPYGGGNAGSPFGSGSTPPYSAPSSSSTSGSSSTATTSKSSSAVVHTNYNDISFVSLGIAAVTSLAQFLLYPIALDIIYYTSQHHSEYGKGPFHIISSSISRIQSANSQFGVFKLQPNTVIFSLSMFVAFIVVYLSLIYVPQFAEGKHKAVCYIMMFLATALALAPAISILDIGDSLESIMGHGVFSAVPMFFSGLVARTAQRVITKSVKSKVLSVFFWLLQVVAFVLVDFVMIVDYVL